MAINIRDLVIDVEKSFNNEFLLADISKSYEYKDGARTEKVDGFRYTVVLPTMKLEKMGIKINDLTPLIDLEKEEIPVMAKVKFVNLTVSPYISNGTVGISAKADKIMFVDSKEIANK